MQEDESVRAEDLEAGDVIFYLEEWRTVLHVYCHHKSCYQKAHLSQKDSTLPLSVKIDRNKFVFRKTKGAIMSANLYKAEDLAKELQQKLADLSALIVAPARLEVVPSVFVERDAIVAALTAEIKKVSAHINELCKKL